MKQVYLISRGSYSDYSVYYVCLDRETAEVICGRLNIGRSGDHYEVEDRPLLDSADDVAQQIRYYVEVDKHGTEVRRHANTHAGLTENMKDFDEAWFAYNKGLQDRNYGAAAVSIRSYEVALRLAREKLQGVVKEV